MGSILRSVLFASIAVGVAACGGVTDDGSGGSGGTGTGGTGAMPTGGTGGTGAAGGETGQPFVNLTATPLSIENGSKALLEWETIDAEQINDIMAGRDPRPPADVSGSGGSGGSGVEAGREQEKKSPEPKMDSPAGEH